MKKNIIKLLKSSDPANIKLGGTMGNARYGEQFFDEWVWGEIHKAFVHFTRVFKKAQKKLGQFNGDMIYHIFLGVSKKPIENCLVRIHNYSFRMWIYINEPLFDLVFFREGGGKIKDAFPPKVIGLSEYDQSSCPFPFGVDNIFEDFENMKKKYKFIP